MNPDVANMLTAGCAIAVLLLVAFVAGWVRGSDAERTRIEKESQRQSALGRIKAGSEVSGLAHWARWNRR